jgi:hypothetical protein
VELESTRPGDILCALFTSGSTGRSVFPLFVLMFKKLNVTFAWL